MPSDGDTPTSASTGKHPPLPWSVRERRPQEKHYHRRAVDDAKGMGVAIMPTMNELQAGDGPTRESRMVVLRRDPTGRPSVWCDPEIADIVQALNAGGVPTVASCCGHGHRPGCIALVDGRELFVAKDHAEARAIDEAFPVDINGAENTAPAIEAARPRKRMCEYFNEAPIA